MSTNQPDQRLTVKLPFAESEVKSFNRQQILAYLRMVAQAIFQTFGSRCEVVIHDFAEPEHSIVFIAGHLTGRKVGGTLTDLGLSLLASGASDERVLTYETCAPDGRRLKSTSAILCDQNGDLFAAFCINVDIEGMEHIASLLAEVAQIPVASKVTEEHFSDDPMEIITHALHEERARFNLAAETSRLKRDQRVMVVQALLERGVFTLRSAPTIVATLLDVSRFTIYNDLQVAKAQRTKGKPYVEEEMNDAHS